jgi:uncharacterized protein involved in outer membrane biogenesis
VRKLKQIVMIVLGAFLALAAVVLLGVNLYVQSQGTQTRIQQELSQRLGTPLNVRRISVTPWGGLKLSGITIPQISGPVSSNFLEASAFRLRISFLSLFSRRLVIKEVSLADPRVIWSQDADGKWRLPGSAERESSRAPITEVPVAEPSPAIVTTGPSAPIQASPTIAQEAQPSRETVDEHATARFVPEIQRINVRRGNFRFLDQSGNFVASFEGLQFRSTIRSGVDLRGNANVARISLRDRFFLDGMHSTLHYDPTELDLSQIFSHAGGGDVTGRFVMQPQAEDSPFNVAVRFRNVEADQIIAEAGGPKGVVRGKLEGNFEATGKIADPNALTGTGEILLQNGQLQQYSLLAALGQILQIEELTQLHLEQAEAKYHINSGVVTVDELILRSPNVRLSAKGTIAFDGKLRLESQLAINDKIRNQLFKPIRANFEPLSESGYYAVDFEVSGTIDRPKSNLVEKVVGRDLKDFGSSVINSLLGGGKSDRQRKKKSGDISPTQSPLPSAAPSATQSEAASSPAASP